MLSIRIIMANKIDPNLIEFVRPLLENIVKRSRWVSFELYQENGQWKKKLVAGPHEVVYLLNPDGLHINGKKIDLDYL